MSHQKYERELEAREDKHQSMLVGGEVKANDFQFATGEQRVLDFNKKVTCPICLSWLLLTKFVVSTEKGYDEESAKCPECQNDVLIKNLFHLGKMKPEGYAKFIVNYPAWEFWKKCPFAEWKKHLEIMHWSQLFWEEYHKLKPKLTDDDTKPKKAKKQFFTKLECKNCIFKVGPYCWGQCPSNIWKKQPDW